MTEERPVFDKTLDSKTFQKFYYTKKELLDFCRENHISTSGGKLELAERIISFLDTGYVLKLASTANRKTHNSQPQVITTSTLIEDKFVCSQKHRAFFEEHIGKQFSFFVSFQKWLKSNAGKTYKDAIDAYYAILEEKKNGKTKIDKQFEYNTYIRDFFEDNKEKSLDDAIKCWKYKKQLKGHNKYEKSDLDILK